MKKILYLFFTLYVLNVAAQIRTPNVADIYSPFYTPLHPVFKLYSLTDSNLRIFFYLNLRELQFEDNIKYKSAKVKFKYIIFESLNNMNVIDSGTKFILIKKTTGNEKLVSYFDIIVPEKSKLALITTDILAGSTALVFFDVDNSKITDKNFLIKSTDNMQIDFWNFDLRVGYPYLISTEKKCNRIFVTHYIADTTFPIPPFASFSRTTKLKKDTVFEVKNNDTLIFPYYGIYFLSIDTVSQNGGVFLSVNEDFPFIDRADRMIAPLKYLTSTAEFKAMNQKKNKKLVLDDFWFRSAGKDKFLAKELIRIFYNRVYFANIYFTSYKPGWKTDRGMIYIVFGVPDYLYKTDNQEIWVYLRNKEKVNFVFLKNNSNFTEKDYILQRKIAYKKYWVDAVNSWRSGNINFF